MYYEGDSQFQVDIFGGCGKKKCDIGYQGGRSSRVDNCTATVEREYMFYLSFENSLCDQVRETMS